jgi:hypothetical protein
LLPVVLQILVQTMQRGNRARLGGLSKIQKIYEQGPKKSPVRNAWTVTISERLKYALEVRNFEAADVAVVDHKN